MTVHEKKVSGGLGLTSRILPYNARSIQAALPRDGRRAVYKIEGVEGLRLHVLPTRRGGISLGPAWKARWYVHYTLRTGDRRPVQQLIGSRATMSLEEARAKAREIITLAQDKKCDPRLQEHRGSHVHRVHGHTFSCLFGDWLAGYAKLNLRSWEQPRDKLAKHAIPFIGDMLVSDIKASHINEVLDRLLRAGKGTQANRVRAHLSTVFRWGLSREYGLEYNPVQLTSRPKRREHPRSVVYEHHEVRALWRAIDDEAVSFGSAIGLVLKLALVTGQRKAELVGALASELQLSGERPVWKLPKERTKGAREQLVPLSPLAARLFSQALESGVSGRPYVFSAASSMRGDKHLAPRSVSQALARSRERIGLRGGHSVHDLRRTVNTEMARLGISSDIRARVLNHARRGITDRVYNVWEYEPEMRMALSQWSEELLRIVGHDDDTLETSARTASVMAY